MAPARSARGPRRAVRRAGTVGTDESVLRSTHPAAPADERAKAATPAKAATSASAATPAKAATPASAATPAKAVTSANAATSAKAATPAGTSDDPVVALRALDDTDVGWGHDPDSNDDRLHRDRPPHW